MAEEFQESDVIFSEKFLSEEPLFVYRENSGKSNNIHNSKRKNIRRSDKTSPLSRSLPVNIPENRYRSYKEYSDEEFHDKGEIIPPHVIAERKSQGKMASSVCTGNGRTLKGRDLSRVRNSVLRMTGFLEV